MYNETYVEERVDKLEDLFGRFVVNMDRTINSLSREMKEFKNEVRRDTKEFKDEMRQDTKEFRDEIRQDTKELKSEMKEFKDELKQDSKKFRSDMNQQWGNLANKMGTLVEDIIAPAVRPAILKYFKEEITYFALNVNKKSKKLNLRGEFDVIAISEENVYLVEVKSRPRISYLNDFVENIETFKKLFPEYHDKAVIPIFASLHFDEPITKLATTKKIYLLAYHEWDYMDIINYQFINEQ